MKVQRKRMRDLSGKVLSLGLAFFWVGNASDSLLNAADCNCDACVANAGCDSPSLTLPKLPCMGNGLFDHLQRITSKMESSLNRLAFGTHGKECDSGCDGGCNQVVSVSSDPIMMAPADSPARYHLGDQNDGAQQSFPSVIPESRFAPPSRAPVEVPQSQPKLMDPQSKPKPGNPFMDEVRAKPVHPSLPTSITRQEVFVLKRTAPKDSLATSTRRQTTSPKPVVASPSPVIQVGGFQSSGAEAAQFAR